MEEKTSALYSEYIIDGTREDLTPAMMLDSCISDTAEKADCAIPCEIEKAEPENPFRPIADETMDPAPGNYIYDNSKIEEYLVKTVSAGHGNRNCPVSFPEQYTRYRIAKSLTDAIWANGHFKLGDLCLSAEWNWDEKPIGNMAAFYASAASAADYIDNLGIRLSSYSFRSSKKNCDISFRTNIRKSETTIEDDEEKDISMKLPFKTGNPILEDTRRCPAIFTNEESSWLIYVPFDQSELKLGGSLLAETLGASGDMAPEINDTDYFIDCYEVIRELVEDGIAIAGITVGDGGLLTALEKMRGEGCGADVEIGSLLKAYEGSDMVQALFSEIPGVVMQIDDNDYDYVDAELLLQDIAYYPLGHPDKKRNGIRVTAGGTSGIGGILQSLLASQASEGED